jgi:integrase
MKRGKLARSEIRVGKLRFEIWRFGDGRYAFDYRSGTKRKIIARKTLAALKVAAQTVAIKIVNGQTEAIQLTPQDCRIYVAARDLLEPAGVHVDAAARDVAEAYKLTGGVSIPELAKFYQRHDHVARSRRTVREVYDELVAAKKHRSGRRRRELKNDLAKFLAVHGPAQICDLLYPDIVAFLQQFNVGWRRYNNISDTLVTLFRFAKKKGYLPQDRLTAPERVDRLPKPKRVAPIPTFSPVEMRAWIANIREEFLPWLLIGGFAGIRSEEISPDSTSAKDGLRWEDFNLERRIIRVRRETAKLDEPRIVPITENLFAWLRPWQGRNGLVCPRSPTKRETSRLSKITGVEIDGRVVQLKWKTNALRHSYGSYRLAIIKNRPQLAEEMGNSPKMIREHYNEAKTEDEAQAWFAIAPREAANVVQARFAL